MSDPTTITARVESALRSEHAKLCTYMLDEAEDPKHGKPYLRTIAARLDQIEAQLADPGPLVERVMAKLKEAA